MSGTGRRIDLTATTWGDWLVLGPAPKSKRSCTSARWVTQCACGTLSTAYSADLRNGKTVSCAACREKRKRAA